jgi:hypothetical protein
MHDCDDKTKISILLTLATNIVYCGGRDHAQPTHKNHRTLCVTKLNVQDKSKRNDDTQAKNDKVIQQQHKIQLQDTLTHTHTPHRERTTAAQQNQANFRSGCREQLEILAQPIFRICCFVSVSFSAVDHFLWAADNR